MRTSGHIVAVGLALAFLAAGPLATPSRAQDEAAAGSDGFLGSVPRASGEITVDGRLDEPAWEAALSLPLPYETRPGENTAAPVETTLFLTYDESHLYVAFDARDPEPERIRARLVDRDTAWNDDIVGIYLDTFNDERRAFGFFANPHGAQMDLFQDDVNRREDETWDAIWDAAGRITDGGYVVEMAVPFSSLRFPRVAGPQTWGVDAMRFWPRTDRVRLATRPLDRGRDCYLCQFAKVRGFEGATPGRNLEIVPTVTAGRTDRRADFPHGRLETGDRDAEAGLTAGWGITPNLNLQATLNPDFSQVEADAAQLEVNERFALFFPEKRPFFLEGQDFFDSPLDVVFTRSVADPAWGLKLTGKEGPHGVGVFVARDELTNLILPGNQRSDSASLEAESLATAVRYRRDFGSNSAIGALATSREGEEGYFNRVGGIDGLYRFGTADSITFQALASSTRYPDSLIDEGGVASGRLSGHAVRLEYRHDARNWTWRLRHDDIADGFRADLGFMPRVGHTFSLAGLQRTWHGEEGDWYNRITLGGDVDRTEDQQGNLIEEEYELFLNYQGPLESGLFLGPGKRRRVFEGIEFDQTYLNASVWIQALPDLFVNIGGFHGDAIDFAHARPGTQTTAGLFLRHTPGKHVRATLQHERRRLDVDDGRLFTADLSRLRLVYQFDLRTFVRVIVEHIAIDRDPTLHAQPVDRESDNLFTQLLFSYKINPQTVAFLGYSDRRLGDELISLTRSSRTVFLKLGYSWNL